MADFVYDRDEMTVITLRVPRRLWMKWEFRHGHYGKAIHAARESLIDVISAKMLRTSYNDQGDPFYADR